MIINRTNFRFDLFIVDKFDFDNFGLLLDFDKLAKDLNAVGND